VRVFTEDELRDSGLVTAIEAVQLGASDDAAVEAAEKAMHHYDDLAFAIREAQESRGDTSGGRRTSTHFVRPARRHQSKRCW